MKIELKSNEVIEGSYFGMGTTWYLKISTKKEDFWLISYHVMSIIIGIIFFSVLTFLIVNNGKEVVEIIDNMWSHRLISSIIIELYGIWLICSAAELYNYSDSYEFSEHNWKTWGRLEFAIRLTVRLVRGLPIIILGIGIISGVIYGLFYLFSLLINLL